MKKGLLVFLVLFIAGTLALGGCKKKEEEAPAPAPEMQQPAEMAPAAPEEAPAPAEAPAEAPPAQ